MDHKKAEKMGYYKMDRLYNNAHHPFFAKMMQKSQYNTYKSLQCIKIFI